MTIFVTGATGTTGTETVRALQKTGEHIRIGARNLDKAKAFKGNNTDFVHFDFEKPETYGPALRGCDRLFLCTPFDANAHERATMLLDAAVNEGVHHVVKLSALGADSVPGITVGRWHRIVERYLQSSGLGWTVLRPAGFMSNFGVFWGNSIKAENKIYLPIGNGKISWIDPRDVSEVAAKVLTTPGQAGRIYNLTGGEAIDTHQVAKMLSQATGRTISYVDVPETTAREGMIKAGLPGWAVDGMMGLYWIWKQGWGAAITNDVEQVLNRKPRTFAEFAKDNAQLFNA